VALLEKVKWVMQDARAHPDRPIGGLRAPKTKIDALSNLGAFCDEVRDDPGRDPPIPDSERLALPPFPPLPACHGWTSVAHADVPALRPPMPEDLDAGADRSWALVYEYVPGSPQDRAVGQAHLDLFYALGFAMEEYKPDNWRGGRLVDHNDVCSPFTRGWTRYGVYRRDAEKWFWTLEFKKPPEDDFRHHIVRRRTNARPGGAGRGDPARLGLAAGVKRGIRDWWELEGKEEAGVKEVEGKDPGEKWRRRDTTIVMGSGAASLDVSLHLELR